MKQTVVIFARAPRFGGVKRRLAAGIGRRRALRFHRFTTESIIRRLARDRRWRTVLAVTGEPWRWPARLPRMVQCGTDLGERMANALCAAPAGPVLLVGSDIPGVTANVIADAFHALRAVDVIFGPARDGGYWLVGVRNRGLLRRLFRGVRWGSEHALADTLKNVPASCRCGLAKELEDVDDTAAWQRWRDSLNLP